MLFVAGIDEAGRGPLAGPVTAACVVLPPGYRNSEITDSKKLSASARDDLYPEITSSALAWCAVSVGARRIESLNIRCATQHAMRFAAERVVRMLRQRYDGVAVSPVLLIDGNMRIGTTWDEEPIIKGDGKIQAIGAASIVAKVTRDRLMQILARHYPGYEFENHKGYGTATHLERIRLSGPCRIHRRTFAGVREHLVATRGDFTTAAIGSENRNIAPENADFEILDCANT